MKGHILSFLIMMLFTVQMNADNIPPKEIFLINSEVVEVSIENETEAELFINVIFNESNEKLEFTTKEVVSYIQIFNESGKLEFQLPIESKDITIGKSLFGEGSYKLGFIVQGMKETQFTEVRFN